MSIFLCNYSNAPPAGFEPAANRLTVDCSTAELQGNVLVMVPISRPYV
jgi:hypothetical protein